MSRTYHHNKKGRRRTVKSSLLKKILQCYSDDIYPKGKGKYNAQGKLVRTRLKKEAEKEISEVEKDVSSSD